MTELNKDQKAADGATKDNETIKAKADKSVAKPKVDDSHLIAVTKDNETIKVHPAALAEHKRLGWVEA